MTNRYSSLRVFCLRAFLLTSDAEQIELTESPEDSADLWVNITSAEDEDREIEHIYRIRKCQTADILLDYGYHISVMPRKNIAEFEDTDYSDCYLPAQ